MHTQRFFGRFLVAMAVAFVSQSAALAADADTQEALRYTLTEAGLAKYAQATKKLSALPDTCEDEGSDTTSIADMVAKIEATPGARAAVQSAGMTSREYAVFLMALVHNGIAAWAASQPGGKLPAGVSKGNVDFVNAHRAEIEALNRQDGCGDDAPEDEEAEDYEN